MELKTKFPVLFKFAADHGKAGKISGYASTFGGSPDSYGDVVEPGAFKATLASHASAGTRPLMLWQHNHDEPIGSWTDLAEDDYGLFGTGQINLDTRRGKDVWALIENGDIDALSIGYSIPPGGAVMDGKIQRLKAVNLFEISPVSFPANRNARLTSKADLADLLIKAGLSRSAASRVAAGGFPALAGQPDGEEEAAAAILDAIKTSTERLRRA